MFKNLTALLLIFLFNFYIVNSQSLQISLKNTLVEPEILFGEIVAAVFDDSLNIYLLDNGNHKIHKYCAEGEYLFSFGDEGRGPGEFLRAANSVAYNPENHEIAIFDYRNTRIIIYDAESGNHRNSILLKSTTGVPVNRLFYFDKQLFLLGSHTGSNKLIHHINKDGETVQSYGEFINFSSFIHNPNAKMQLSQINVSSLNDQLLSILQAPKRVKLFDNEMHIIKEFENDFLPVPWVTHMEITPTSYRSTFYSMSVNNLFMSDNTYLLQWSEVIDPEGPVIEHRLDLRSLRDGNLLNRSDLGGLFIVAMKRLDKATALIFTRNSSFDYTIYKISIM